MNKQELFDLVEAAMASTQEAVDEMNTDNEAFERAQAAGAGLRESLRITSVASHVQGIYSSIEGTLERVTKAFGEKPSAAADWHLALLNSAAAATKARPAILSADTHKELSALRAFRHAVRVKYGSRLDERTLPHREGATRAVQLLQADFKRFFEETQEPPEPVSKSKK